MAGTGASRGAEGDGEAGVTGRFRRRTLHFPLDQLRELNSGSLTASAMQEVGEHGYLLGLSSQ